MRPCKRIFVCSRYYGDTEYNIKVAEQFCRMVVDAGHAPFAPHLIYTRFLNDDYPEERECGITLGLQFMEVCDEVWVYTKEGISAGMQKEVDHGQKLGKQIIMIHEVKLCQGV